MYTLEQLQNKSLKELKEIGWELNALPAGDRRYRENWIKAIAGVNPPLLQLLEVSPGVEVDRAQEPIIETVEASPAAEADQAQETIESKFGRIVYSKPAQGLLEQAAKTSPAAEADQAQETIAPATKNLPGSRSKTSTAHQLLELFKSSAHILEDSPGVKTATAIVPAAKNRTEEGSDQNPILTGIPLSDRFVTRYTPPQPEIIHFQSDADGQLSLLDFEVKSVEEPPDPDDLESLDAFREAIARWDLEHPSSFDHCSDHLPSSEDNDVSSEDKPLELSLDSFCLWAHCPADWYEPAPLLEVIELSSVQKTSSTSDFFIPTFDAWCDRSNGIDEPPDTGIFAKLPKPKPPRFPPAASQPLVNQVSRNYPQTIPKLFHRVVAGRILPARSPPGGDAMS